jgi:nicotinamide-nucleotide amidase
MASIAQDVGILLEQHKLTLGTVESATGGLISHHITDVPGSSNYFMGSIVSYSNGIKTSVVKVKPDSLEKYGAVSAQVAEEMAESGRRVLGVDICISDTGIAGPTGATRNKPIGLFYLGLSSKDGTFNRKHLFSGNRQQNKEMASQAALTWLKEYLTGYGHARINTGDVKVKEVVTCFLSANNRILLLKRSSKVGTYKGLWAAVSGYMDRPADEQAWIEIREETGLTKKEARLAVKGQQLEVMDIGLKTRWIVHPYLFKVNRLDAIKIDWEHSETKWIDPAVIGNFDIVPGLEEALFSVMPERRLDGTGTGLTPDDSR